MYITITSRSCISYYFRDRNGKPARKLTSFIGQVKESNDVYFVITVFLQFIIPQILLERWKRVRFFTDGGPKHFKCSAFLYFLWSIWNHYKVSDLEYNFFASYHGCNGCDGAAAQAAAKVRIFQAESGSFPSDAKELKSILDDLSNHNYTIIPRIERPKNKKPLEFINIATY